MTCQPPPHLKEAWRDTLGYGLTMTRQPPPHLKTRLMSTKSCMWGDLDDIKSFVSRLLSVKARPILELEHQIQTRTYSTGAACWQQAVRKSPPYHLIYSYYSKKKACSCK